MHKILQFTLLIAGLALIEVFSGACATSGLWSHNQKSYVEKVRSFQMTPDSKRLIVLGEQYHYIFDISPNLAKTLDSPFRPSLQAAFYSFHVSDENKVVGRYTLRLPARATEEAKQQATADGFAINQRTGEYSLTEDIHGTRYSAANFKYPDKLTGFNKTYIITVTEPQGASDVAGKILLTPVTLAVDGALIYAGAVLVAVAIPVVAITSTIDRATQH